MLASFPIETRTLEAAFPTFDVDSLPAIPTTFEDSSWANDQCPRFEDERHGLAVYVDFAAPDEREFPESPRYTLQKRDPHGDGTFSPILDSDEWTDILHRIAAEVYGAPVDENPTVMRLAREFSSGIRFALTTEEFAECLGGTLCESDPLVCRTHDFIDPNMTMLEAFRHVMGRDPAFAYNSESPSGNRERALWNRAWFIAKRNLFAL